MIIHFVEHRTQNTERYFCWKRFRFDLLLILVGAILVFGGATNQVRSATLDNEIETKYNQTREAFFALDKSPQKDAAPKLAAPARWIYGDL